MPDSIVVTPRQGRRTLALTALRLLKFLNLVDAVQPRDSDRLLLACKHDLLLAELERAIPLGQLRLHYQPVVNLQEEGCPIVGFEALVRWEHPKRGLLYPGEFIPAAEESSLIFDLFKWVVRESCHQIFRWRGHYWVSVNISPRQIPYGDTTGVVMQAIQEAAIAPGLLHLEVTESGVTEDADIEEVIQQLQGIGIQICLDDFGVAYSSYARMLSLKIDLLKVDREFLQGKSDRHLTVYDSIIRMAHDLDLKVIGEGVEQAVQAEQLRLAGCDYGQGFYFGRPAPANEVLQ